MNLSIENSIWLGSKGNGIRLKVILSKYYQLAIQRLNCCDVLFKLKKYDPPAPSKNNSVSFFNEVQ